MKMYGQIRLCSERKVWEVEVIAKGNKKVEENEKKVRREGSKGKDVEDEGKCKDLDFGERSLDKER